MSKTKDEPKGEAPDKAAASYMLPAGCDLYQVEIPRCLIPMHYVIAPTPEHALRTFCAHGGILGHEHPAKINVIDAEAVPAAIAAGPVLEFQAE